MPKLKKLLTEQGTTFSCVQITLCTSGDRSNPIQSNPIQSNPIRKLRKLLTEQGTLFSAVQTPYVPLARTQSSCASHRSS